MNVPIAQDAVAMITRCARGQRKAQEHWPGRYGLSLRNVKGLAQTDGQVPNIVVSSGSGYMLGLMLK